MEYRQSISFFTEKEKKKKNSKREKSENTEKQVHYPT